MRILGIDPGSRAAGWAVVSFDGAPRLVAAGVLRPDTTVPFCERLLALRNGLRDVIVRERPDVAAIERVFSGVNPQSLITLGEARGVLLLALAEAGLPVAEITPAEIKRAVAGSGGAEKEQVRRMVASILASGGDEKRLALDAADAAAAAITHGFLVARRHVTPLVRRAPDGFDGASGAPEKVIRRRPSG
ncbi:MAG: crossover junction endodeoxyribonuclease RuvC [Thermoanaerobaculia bacterium]